MFYRSVKCNKIHFNIYDDSYFLMLILTSKAYLLKMKEKILLMFLFFKCFFHVLQIFLSVGVVVPLLLQRPAGRQTIYLFHPRRKCTLNLSPFYPFILRPGREQASYITHVLMQPVIGLGWQREGAHVWLSALLCLSLTFHFYPNSRPPWKRKITRLGRSQGNKRSSL